MNTYSRRGIHGHVVDALGLRVVNGEFLPGSVVDPELIASEYGVSRTVVREAFKVLAAKGLVEARTRTGTRVTDRGRWHLLDNDVMNWRSRGMRDPSLVLELGEVRQIIEPAGARMAAERRTAEHVARLRTALTAMIECDDENFDALVQADLDFHRTVLLAAGNELLQHFEVILEPALQARDALLHHPGSDRSFIAAHADVLEAIDAHDADRAYMTMSRLVATAARDAASALARERGSII